MCWEAGALAALARRCGRKATLSAEQKRQMALHMENVRLEKISVGPLPGSGFLQQGLQALTALEQPQPLQMLGHAFPVGRASRGCLLAENAPTSRS